MSGSLSSLLGAVPGGGPSPALLALLAGTRQGQTPAASPLAALTQPQQKMGQNPPAPMLNIGGGNTGQQGAGQQAGDGMQQFAQLLKMMRDLQQQQQQQGQQGASAGAGGTSGGASPWTNFTNWLSGLFGGGGSTFTPSATGTYGGQQVYTGPTNVDAPIDYTF